MPATHKPYSLLNLLITLTLTSILTQILFIFIYSLTHDLFDVTLHFNPTHLKWIAFPLLKFIFYQFTLQAIYISIIGYLTLSISELFAFSKTHRNKLGIFLWCISQIAILSANCYYTPNSFFAKLICDHLFNGALTPAGIQLTMIVTTSLFLFCMTLTLINLLISFFKKRHLVRHGFVLGLFLLIFLAYLPPFFQSAKPQIHSQPNIIIIGLDAIRPDMLSFYHPSNIPTPHINDFLKHAISFSENYTPLARTFPAWTSILTAMHPKSNGARGNNTDLALLQLNETLPKHLQAAGYETWFATDDNRFNNVNKSFGFDHIIGAPMGINEAVLGSINDFPLSNLLISTKLGKLFFPYSYANHAAPITYQPNDFLTQINDALQHRADKPLFFAIHFNLTGWPFYWFNDKQAPHLNDLQRYQYSIAAADQQLAELFALLTQHQLLDHTIVILLSDHGITFGSPGDRIITKKNYVGDPKNIQKIPVHLYNSASPSSLDFQHDYGIDTSYGYGIDLLGVKQFHSLLAMKGYGIDLGAPKIISQRSSLMDIAPTLLDFLKLPALTKSDAVSLRPYFNSSIVYPERRFFLETSFSIPEIETNGINPEKVIKKTIHLYVINPNNGLFYFDHAAEKIMIQNKQRAVLQGDWLLIRVPASLRSKLVSSAKNMQLQSDQVPPYFVLINLKSGAWTLEFTSRLAMTAPVGELQRAFWTFYGDEIS